MRVSKSFTKAEPREKLGVGSVQTPLKLYHTWVCGASQNSATSTDVNCSEKLTCAAQHTNQKMPQHGQDMGKDKTVIIAGGEQYSLPRPKGKQGLGDGRKAQTASETLLCH